MKILIITTSAPKFTSSVIDHWQVEEPRWPNISQMLINARSEVLGYNYVILPDKCIKWSGEAILAICELMDKYKIDLGTPAIEGQQTRYRALWKQEGIGRLVNFIENVTPIFSQGALWKVHWSFRESREGGGIDSIWAHEIERKAVFDVVSVERDERAGDIYEVSGNYRREAERVHILYNPPKCDTIGEL